MSPAAFLALLLVTYSVAATLAALSVSLIVGFVLFTSFVTQIVGFVALAVVDSVTMLPIHLLVECITLAGTIATATTRRLAATLACLAGARPLMGGGAAEGFGLEPATRGAAETSLYAT